MTKNSDYSVAQRLRALTSVLYKEPPSAPSVEEIEHIPVDIEDTPEAYLYVFDMPGIAGDDVQVKVETREPSMNWLKIMGKRTRDGESEQDKGKATGWRIFLQLERKMGNFEEEFFLQQDANLEKITASFRDGALTVKVPKVNVKVPKEDPVTLLDRWLGEMIGA